MSSTKVPVSEHRQMNEREFAEQFTVELFKHAKRKATLYDGVERAGRGANNMIPDFFLRCAAEELGEIASALTRERMGLVYYECIDLAHCALLIALAVHTQLEGEDK